MIKSVFENIQQTRQVFSALLNSLSVEQLNTIPAGFNNNIIWNFGHIIVTTPALIYQRSGVRPDYQIPLQHTYQKGSKPKDPVSASDIIFLKEIMRHTLEDIEQDYNKGLLGQGFVPFSTSTYGNTLHNIEEVLLTTLMHDNLHLGYAQAQRRLLISI